MFRHLSISQMKDTSNCERRGLLEHIRTIVLISMNIKLEWNSCSSRGHVLCWIKKGHSKFENLKNNVSITKKTFDKNGYSVAKTASKVGCIICFWLCNSEFLSEAKHKESLICLYLYLKFLFWFLLIWEHQFNQNYHSLY